MFRRFFLIFVLFPYVLFGEIFEIKDLSFFEKRLESVDSSVLILFDVDDTLISPKDMLLKRCNTKLIYKLLVEHGSFCDLRKPRHEYLLSIILAQAEFELVNPKSIELIQNLQSRRIPTFAFTAAPAGQLGKIDNLAQWRFDQLKHRGLDFQSFLGSDVCIEWEKKLNQKTPVFFKGILFASFRPKGEVLLEFLKKLDCKFSKIFLLDDRREYLESVDCVLKKNQIPFEGYLYQEAISRSYPVDDKIARKQIQTLLKEEKWLSDEESKQFIDLKS